jgi:hypothetical protein
MGSNVRTAPTSWPASLGRAAVMLAVSVVLFLFVPNRLLGYLSIHIVPTWRDFLMLVYWVVAFVFACWLFVFLQRGRAR